MDAGAVMGRSTGPSGPTAADRPGRRSRTMGAVRRSPFVRAGPGRGSVRGVGSELRGLVEVPFVVAGDVAACVEGVHRAIAGRVLDAAGPAAVPIRLLHDGIAGGV